MDIIIDGNIQPSDGFMIGATTSQILDLTLLNKGDMVYGTSTINVEIGLKIGNKIEYILMGIYNIDDIEKTDYTIKITAFDNMMKFEKNFISNLGDTLTLQQVVNELVRITGVQFTGNLPAYTVKKLEGFSCREILGYVASLCGGNAIITRDGKFTIVTPKDNSYSIGTSNYFDYKREETKYKIGKISCQSGEEILSKGSIGVDSMELQFENPWVNNTILTDIYTKLNGFEYLGYSMKWQGDPSLDVGDIVTITDKKGVVRKHPILSQKFTYTGGLTAEMGAKGENKNKNEFSGSGPSAKKVERVVMELALINKALIDVAYIGDLTAGNIKFDTASGTIMDLQTLLAKFVTGENGQFLNLTTDNVTISNAVIKDIIAKNISVEDLKVGNIDSNRFNIVGTDGNLLIKDNTIQIKDSARVRVQIGKDASGDYSMYVWDKQGNLMFDALGLKSSAIKDKIIRDDMVADNANINGSKLNISSLITEVNKDNTQTLKASRISFDSTGQSLEVSFNSLKSNVDNMEIGGRNLQGNADFNKPLSGTWRYDAQFMSINEEILCDGYKSVKILRTNATTTSTRYLYTGGGIIPAKYEEEFTMSFMYYIPEDVEQEIDGTFQAGVWFYKDGNAGAGSTRKNLENEIVKGKWIKVVVSGKAKNVDTKSVAFVIGFDKNCEVYISKPKLERGNKATDFTVAPEDVEEKIESNTTAITVAQGKIEGLIKESTINKSDVTTLKDNYTSIKATVDGINTTVASHTSSIVNLTTDLSGVSGKVATIENKQATLEQNLNGFKTTVSNTYSTKTELNTAKIDAINSANNSTDNKLKNYSTTIAMNTAITQSANSVKTEVSNTYLSKGEATNTYATKASMELTANQLKLDFSSSGGYNLIKDSNLINNDKFYWWHPYVGSFYWQRNSGQVGIYTRVNEATAIYQTVQVKPYTTYTLSAVLTPEVSTSGAVLIIELPQENGRGITSNIVEAGTSRRESITITTQNSTEMKIAVKHLGSKNNTGGYVCWIKDLLLTEGKLLLPWTPNPNEVYSGNTIIDGSGVKISNGALTVLNNSGQVMLQGDSAGNLIFEGRLQPYDHIIKLFGEECRIDADQNILRIQKNRETYISIDNSELAFYTTGNNKMAMAFEPGANTALRIWGNRSGGTLKFRRDIYAVESRNSSDNGYGSFIASAFNNASSREFKTDITEPTDIDFINILKNNHIKKYKLKADIERLESFPTAIDKDGKGMEIYADEKLGFILEELTEEAKLLLNPRNTPGIDSYSMCSMLWGIVQEQQKRIEALENLQ